MGNTCSSKSHQSVDTSNQEKEKLNQNDIVPYACKDDKNSNKKDDKENINNEILTIEKNISQRNLSLNINKQNQSQKQSDKLEITLSVRHWMSWVFLSNKISLKFEKFLGYWEKYIKNIRIWQNLFQQWY